MVSEELFVVSYIFILFLIFLINLTLLNIEKSLNDFISKLERGINKL